MELVVLLCAVSLLHSCEAQESSAVTPVFVKKGEDVLLNVTTADVPQDFIIVGWKFNNKKEFLVRVTPGRNTAYSDDYKGRIEFSVKNYSMKLKNLQKADSGVYTAVVVGDEDLTNAEYNITVQDPVSPVELAVKVSSSSDWCNLTVSCRAQDSHINSTFRCDAHTCSQEGGERTQVTPSAAALQVYLSNGAIICNHSNQVNWTRDVKIIENFCSRRAVPDHSTNAISVGAGIGIGIFIFILSVAAAVFCCHRKRGQYKRKSMENTVYDIPQVGPTALPQSPTVEVIDLSPTSTYSLVGPHTGSVDSSTTRGTTQPESVYAQVDKPARSLNK